MTDTPANGKPFGGLYTFRRSYLAMLEQSIRNEADLDARDQIPSFAYSGMSQRKVKVQLVYYETEAP
jgi:hypothetical protein